MRKPPNFIKIGQSAALALARCVRHCAYLVLSGTPFGFARRVETKKDDIFMVISVGQFLVCFEAILMLISSSNRCSFTQSPQLNCVAASNQICCV